MNVDFVRPTSRISANCAEWAYRVARRFVTVQVAHVLRLDLATVQLPDEPMLELDYRFIGSSDVRNAAIDPCHDLDASLAARLASGRDLCFAAFHGERLANYSWFAVESVEPEHSFGADLHLPPDTVYLYKAYTVPSYRGQRIHGAALYRAAEFFRRCGHAQMIGIVEFANWASLRSHARLGFRPVGRLLTIGGKSIGWGCRPLLRRDR
jgi:GNAT superfamily N-acetyltransferase